MIETIVLNYLTGLGFSAVTEVPEGGITPPCCLIEKTGGGENDHIRRATVAVQSYGASLYEAASLNEQAVAAMAMLPSRPEVSACRLNSDYNFTDSAKKLYRYQAVFDIVYYD